MSRRRLLHSGAVPAPLVKFVSLWSFGASCVLAFGQPDSPLTQPRTIIGGHLVATSVGLLVAVSFGSGGIAGAHGVGIALMATQITCQVPAPGR